MTAETVIAAAKSAGLMLSTAESCTGGLVAAALTDPPGASAVVDRGFVTYSNAAKVAMLGVASGTLDAHGAVSEAVAREMAEGALSRSMADIAVAITGIAGPGGGSAAKPEGLVCFAIAHVGGTTAETVTFGALGRNAVRQAAVAHALALFSTAIDTIASGP